MSDFDFDFDGVDLDDTSDIGGDGFDNSFSQSGADFDMSDFGGEFDGLDDGTQSSSGSFGDMANDLFSDASNDPNDGNSFDMSMDTPQDTGSTGLNKQYLIIIAAGVAVIMLVLIIAGVISRSKRNKDNVLPQVNTEQSGEVQKNNNVNADNIMQNTNSNKTNASDNSQSSTSIKYVEDESDMTWLEITDNENIQFNADYTDMTFTITGVKHYARTVDTNNNLVVKTRLLGSISGLSGTYTLDVPYEKGIKLGVGTYFTVKVELGTYNGKTVVGDITY